MLKDETEKKNTKRIQLKEKQMKDVIKKKEKKGLTRPDSLPSIGLKLTNIEVVLT
jgi:hypothetical protein